MRDLIDSLATSSLRNYRVGRYLGDDQCLQLSAFAQEDQETVRFLYDFLQELVVANDSGDTSMGAVKDVLADYDVLKLVERVRLFGQESRRADSSEIMGKTVHDLRGGGLAPLLGQLQLTELLGLDDETVRTLFFLSRDHLKIMRNALLGLDDAKREEDLTPKLHSIDFIVEKWQRALLTAGKNQARLEIDCDFHGNISECCVEFGALDRILYNLINNACRHTASDTIQLQISPANDAGDDLRFVLANAVMDEDATRLRERDLSELFQPGISSTGSGLGMTVAADFVTNAYGLASREVALEGRYLGAALADAKFVVWFYWPIAPEV